MNVLMLTRRVDADGWLTGFTHGWVRALAEHPEVEHLDVICLEMGRSDLPPNVTLRSMGKEKGYSRPRELLEFYRALGPATRRADVLFGHMIARYTLVAAPWALLRGLPVVQWYTHRHINREMRLVYRFAKRVVTASPESFQMGSPEKVRVLGHGIDMHTFSPNGGGHTQPRLVTAVGRLSPIKHYEALIEAAAVLVHQRGISDLRVKIAGGVTPQQGEAYADSLRALIAERGLAEHVTLLGPVPHREVADLVRQAAVTTNLCPTGGVDKAVIESMACGVPTVVRNRTFLPLLGADSDLLWTEDLDPERIADRLEAVLALPAAQRQALGLRLRSSVQAGYALDSLVDRLVGVFREVLRER